MKLSSGVSLLEAVRAHRCALRVTAWLQIVLQLLLMLLPLQAWAASPHQPEIRLEEQTLSRASMYTLQPGENARLIAQRKQISLDALWELNKYRQPDRAAMLRLGAGDILLVPMSERDQALPVLGSTALGKEEGWDLRNVAQQAKAFGQATGSRYSDGDAAGRFAQNQLAQAASSSVEGWLSQFGTVRANLAVSDGSDLDTSSLDMLTPIWQSRSRIFFTQFGVRDTDDRVIANLGIGQRHFTDFGWMFGYNLFYDQEVTNNNARLGLGGEAWRDYLKLSANVYMRLTNWVDSKQLEDYEERPANGWDVTAQGYLPAYPQVGGKLAYEQYYGNSVALFGTENRQSNPHAITLGVNYTPVPLVSLGVDYRDGKGGVDETRYSLMFNYTFGVPWEEQISPENVALKRSLAGSRLDLVDRNNDIVMEFRKKILISLGLPAQISGRSGELYDINYTLQSKYALSRIDWQQSELAAAGGAIIDAGNGRYQVKMPPFRYDGSPNSYPISGIATDRNGNRSNTASSVITVSGAAIDSVKSTTTATPTNIFADAQSTSLIEVRVFDTDGNPVSGLGDALKMTLAETLSDSSTQPAVAARLGTINESAAGVYQVLLTAGNNPGSVVITPSVGDIGLTPVTVNENQLVRNARIASLKVNKNRAIANGQDPVVYTALVVDDNDQPVKGAVVRWLTSLGEDSVPSSVTDDQGLATVTLTSTEAGVAEEIAQVNLSNVPNAPEPVQAPPVLFVPDAATARFSQIATDKTQALANGSDAITVTVTVVDANDNPIPAQSINWATTLGAMSATSSVTDLNGNSSITLTSGAAGVGQVTATLGNGAAITSNPLTFSGDPATARIVSLTPDKIAAVANGTDAVTYDTLVVDANNNPLGGLAVTLSSDLGTLAAPQGVTDAQGHYLTTLTSTLRGVATVSGVIANQPATRATPVTFSADAASATVTALTVDKRLVLANGTDQATYTATVTDSNGNPVANQLVNWGTTFGNLAAATSATGLDGTTTITLTSLQAGSAVVDARIGSGAPRTAEEVVFTGDPATVTVAALTPDKNSAVANGTDTITYVATVRDINNNPVPGQTVTLATTLGTLATTTAVTDANGQVSTALTSLQAGPATVSASLSNGASINASEVIFIADASTARITGVTVDKTQAVANGTDLATYTATVTDANNNPLAQVPVNWATTLGILSGAQSATGSNGQATITLGSTQAGPALVNAQLAGGTASDAPQVTFVADAATARISALTVDKPEALANGTDPLNYTATVTDASGNPLVGQTVTLVTDRGNFRDGASAPTNDAGQITLPLVGTQAGPVAVTGSVNGGAAVAAPAAAFIADASTAHITLLEPDKLTALANGGDVVTYTATVQDAFLNPVPNLSVAFTTDLGTLTASSATTDAEGKANVGLTSVVAGQATVTGTPANGNPVTAGVVTFTADLSTATITVEANTTSVPANGTTPIVITGTVRDANGNPIANQPVTYTTDFGQLSVPGGTTDANGQVTFNLTSQQAGTANTVAVRLDNGITGSGGPYQFVPDLATAQVTLTPSNNGIYATDTDNAVTVNVHDAFNNPIVGSVTLTASDPAVAFTGSPITLDAAGNGSATVRSAAALPSVTLTATLDQETSKTAAANVSFTVPVSVVSREAVDANGGNANGKTFSQGPSIAWPGARFHITTAGGSGTLNWTSDNSAVTVQNDGTVTFDSNPGKGEITITITDTLTQQVVIESWRFVSWFNTAGSSSSGDHLTAESTCAGSGGLPTLGNMSSLVGLWGNMSVYNWDTSTSYWTNEVDVAQLNYYFAVDLIQGQQSSYPDTTQTAYVCGGE